MICSGINRYIKTVVASAALALLAAPFLQAGTPRSARYDGSDGARYAFQTRYNRNVAMSLEAWVYRENAARTESIISHNFSQSYWLGFVGGTLRFYRSGGALADADVPVAARQWTHVAATYDGATVRFYIDGQAAGVKTLGHSGNGASGSVYVGRDAGASFRFLGNIDEIRLWSDVRTAIEIVNNLETEVRGAANLEAIWDTGGDRELISVSAGIADPTLPEVQVFGIVPRKLRVPQVTSSPNVNGNIDLNVEYPEAEQLVLRYRDGANNVHDAVAYLVHNSTRLYVGVRGARLPAGGAARANSALAIQIDTNGDGNGLPLTFPEIQGKIFLDGRGREFRRGAGGFPAGLTWGEPLFVSPTQFYAALGTSGGSEFTAQDMEFNFLFQNFLGGTNETDRLGLSHISHGGPDGSHHAPDIATTITPGFWAEMIYTDEAVSLPSVQISGSVRNPNTGEGIGGIQVSLQHGANVYDTATSSDSTTSKGTWTLSGTVAPGVDLRVQVTLPAEYRAEAPETFGIGLLPRSTSLTTATYDPCEPGMCNFADLTFNLIPPPADAELVSFTPDSAWPPIQVRGGADPRRINSAKIQCVMTNFHDLLEFYLVRTGCPNDPSAPGSFCDLDQEYFAVTEVNYVSGSPDLVELTVPDISTFNYGSYRVVAHDTWGRSGNNPINVSSWRYAPGTISIGPPPYPLLHGFHFYNKSGGGSPEEFTSVYGLNMFADPIFCAPWPHYILWYPVYEALANDDGSCVGIAVTSRRLEQNDYPITRWDADAILPNGHAVGPLFRLNPGRSPAVFGHEPPKPETWSFDFPCRFAPDNLWAEICRNHGAQLSNEMIQSQLSQLFGAGSFPDRTLSIDGEPTAVLNRLSADIENFVVCMTPQLGRGHCVTPFAIQHGFRHPRPDMGESFPVSDPDFSLIHVYDNNGPDRVRYIDIDRVDDQFYFPYIFDDDGNVIYAGRAITANPLSIWRGGRSMPDIRLTTYVHFIIFGSATGMHRDDAGNSWGYDAAGVQMDSIPGVKTIPAMSGPDGEAEHAQGFFEKGTVFGNSDIQVQDDGDYGMYIAHEGVAFRLHIADAKVGEAADLQLLTQAGGALEGISYTPGTSYPSTELHVGLVPNETESVSFSLENVSLNKDSAYEVKADREARGIHLQNNGPELEFKLVVNVADTEHATSGRAEHPSVILPAGSTGFFSLPHYPAFDTLQFDIDLGSDGSIESMQTIDFGVPEVELTRDGSFKLHYNILYSGWQLQRAENILGPWTNVSVPSLTRSLNGDRVELTLPASAGEVYYRLERP